MKSPAEERADQLTRRCCSAAALLCCACPQQRQLSEGLAASLCRLLSDAFALLRKPLEHTCDVHRTLLQTLEGTAQVLAWLCKRIISCLHGWFIPTVPQLRQSRPLIRGVPTPMTFRRWASTPVPRGGNIVLAEAGGERDGCAGRQ